MPKQNLNILGCCKVEAVVPVDKRGQMVLPKDIRDKADIKAGDKLAVVTAEQKNRICCIALIKAEQLENTVKNIMKTLGKQTK